MDPLARASLLPEAALPDSAELIREGLAIGRDLRPAPSAFQRHYHVASEVEYKRKRVAEGGIMFHAQIGFRSVDKTIRACAEIYETLEKRGCRVDRFGMTLDRNMGYPPGIRHRMPKGTGLILETPEAWRALTASAPVAAHFGDFMIGMPAAVENTAAAIEAGATVIGNLAHFYNYRMLYQDDEIQRASAAIKAISLIAAQPSEILVSSNVDDGFGSLFVDVACSLGLVLIEQHIVEGLLGARHATVFGNTFANPYNRMVFQRALARIGTNPGPMVYGSTTRSGTDHAVNRATLATYLGYDIAAQHLRPSGHAVTAIPVTEYERIPDTDEIIEAQVFANRLAALAPETLPLLDTDVIDQAADRLVAGGRRFMENTLRALSEAGIDRDDPLELLLAIRRLGAAELERRFGPGQADERALRGRRPILTAEALLDIEARAKACLEGLDRGIGDSIRCRGFVACIATTDVHEYGMMLVGRVLRDLEVEVLEGGVSADPGALAAAAQVGCADFIALSTYNGIALAYLESLRAEMDQIGLAIPVFVGGRINQVPKDSNTSLPVDVGLEIEALGARVCGDVGAMLTRLAADLPPVGGAARQTSEAGRASSGGKPRH